MTLDEDGEQKGMTFVVLEPEVKWQRETKFSVVRGEVWDASESHDRGSLASLGVQRLSLEARVMSRFRRQKEV